MQGKLYRPKEFRNSCRNVYIDIFISRAHPNNLRKIIVSVIQLAMWCRIKFKIICHLFSIQGEFERQHGLLGSHVYTLNGAVTVRTVVMFKSKAIHSSLLHFKEHSAFDLLLNRRKLLTYLISLVKDVTFPSITFFFKTGL